MTEKISDNNETEDKIEEVFAWIGLTREKISERGDLRYTVFLAFKGEQDPGLIAAEIDRDVFCVMSGKHQDIRSIRTANVFERTGLYMEWIAWKVSRALEGWKEEMGNGLSSMAERTVLTSGRSDNPRGESVSFSEEISAGIEAAIAMRRRGKHKN